jgi:hypothetical protein
MPPIKKRVSLGAKRESKTDVMWKRNFAEREIVNARRKRRFGSERDLKTEKWRMTEMTQ